MNYLQLTLCAVAITGSSFTLSADLKAQGTAIQTQPEQSKEYTDEELKTFVEIGQEISKVQQEAQEKLMSAISKENMDVETFNKIAGLQQAGESVSEAGITDEQVQSFRNIMPVVQSTQAETQKEMMEVINNSRVDLAEYEKFMMTLQQDPELQKKMNEMMSM